MKQIELHQPKSSQIRLNTNVKKSLFAQKFEQKDVIDPFQPIEIKKLDLNIKITPKPIEKSKLPEIDLECTLPISQQIDFLIEQTRASNSAVQRTAIRLLQNLFTNLLDKYYINSLEEKQQIEVEESLSLIQKFLILPTQLIDKDVVTKYSLLDIIFSIQFDPELLSQIFLQDECYVFEQLLSFDTTYFLRLGEFQISLIQMGLVERIFQYLNQLPHSVYLKENKTQQQRLSCFLLLERIVLGCNSPEYQQLINLDFIKKFFTDEYELQLHELEEKGFMLDGCGRVSLRVLAGLREPCNLQVALLLKNYLEDKNLELLQLILLKLKSWKRSQEVEGEQVAILKDFLVNNFAFEAVTREAELMAEIAFLLQVKDLKFLLSGIPEQQKMFHPFLCVLFEQHLSLDQVGLGQVGQNQDKTSGLGQNLWGMLDQKIAGALKKRGYRRLRLNDLGIAALRWSYLDPQFASSIQHFANRQNQQIPFEGWELFCDYNLEKKWSQLLKQFKSPNQAPVVEVLDLQTDLQKLFLLQKFDPAEVVELFSSDSQSLAAFLHLLKKELHPKFQEIGAKKFEIDEFQREKMKNEEVFVGKWQIFGGFAKFSVQEIEVEGVVVIPEVRKMLEALK